ncbi:hypothetical protein ACJX0J_030217, partial [Zea mays]
GILVYIIGILWKSYFDMGIIMSPYFWIIDFHLKIYYWCLVCSLLFGKNQMVYFSQSILENNIIEIAYERYPTHRDNNIGDLLLNQMHIDMVYHALNFIVELGLYKSSIKHFFLKNGMISIQNFVGFSWNSLAQTWVQGGKQDPFYANNIVGATLVKARTLGSIFISNIFKIDQDVSHFVSFLQHGMKEINIWLECARGLLSHIISKNLKMKIGLNNKKMPLPLCTFSSNWFCAISGFLKVHSQTKAALEVFMLAIITTFYT